MSLHNNTTQLSMVGLSGAVNQTLDTNTEIVSWSVLICSLLGIFAITFNLFIILGIGTVKELLTKSNIEIINLAAADFATGLVMFSYSFFLVRDSFSS